MVQRITSRRLNNVKRTEWNKKCREKLSAHICKSHHLLWSDATDTIKDKRLEIVIEASQVRLKINSNNSYIWKKMNEKEHLFLKKLSDLSIDQLKDLCDDIDRSFIVIWKASLQSKPLAQNEEESVRVTYPISSTFSWLLKKFLKFLKSKVSFVAKNWRATRRQYQINSRS